MNGPANHLSTFITRTRFQKSVRRYMFSNLEDDLRIASKITEKLWAGNKLPIIENRKIIISGWISKKNLGKLRADHLQAMNPSYKFKVHRSFRKDLFVHRKAYGLFAAFKIVIHVANEDEARSKPIALFMAKETGGLEFLAPSNPNAKRNMRTLLKKPPVGATMAVGFIDSLKASGLSGTEDLVLSATEELLVFGDSNTGRFICSKAANILMAHGRAEQAEKFSFLGNLPHEKFQIFREVAVRRHFPPIADVPKGNRRITMTRKTNEIVEAQVTNKTIPYPKKGWLDVRGAELLRGSIVLNNGTLENYEHAADPTWDFVSGLWQVQFGSQNRRDSALIKISKKYPIALRESILIGGRNDSNYFHFLVEYLPRILTIPNSISKSAPILISNSVPKSGVQALEKLTNRKIIKIDPLKTYQVSRLHVSAPVSQVLDTTKVPWSDGLFIDLKTLQVFRERCLSLFSNPTLPPRRIYLRRQSGHRNLSNGAQLEKIARRMGFEVIDIKGMSWEKQVRLFSNCQVVVGAGGAVMANYIFLPKGAKVISLTSDYLADFSLPAYMASVAEASFTYVTGKAKMTRTSRTSTQEFMHLGFKIRKSSFTKALRSITI